MEPKIASRACRLVTVALLCAVLPRPVQAQPEGSNAARAQRLFDDARALMKEGRFAEACPKLAESQALDPGGGTLLNLGICWKQEGRTATAHRILSDALAQARTDGRSDRVATAERHLAELAPRLSRLTIVVPPRGLPEDVTVTIDGSPVTREPWGTALPVDPGEHELTATQPGHEDFSQKFELGAEADSKQLFIPELPPLSTPNPVPLPPPLAPEPVAVEPPHPVPAAAPPPPQDNQTRTVGWALVGGGAASMALGTYFGARALSLKADSDRYYDGTHCTQQSCVDDFNQAKSSALVSDIALGVGAVAIGAGLYLVLKPLPTAPKTLAFAVSASPYSAIATARSEF